MREPVKDKIMIFDLDGALLELQRESAAFVAAFQDCYGITGISDDWSSYHAGSDKEIAASILEQHFGRKASKEEISRIEARYACLLKDVLPVEIAGAGVFLDYCNRVWNPGFALSTGNWKGITRLRLDRAGLWGGFSCGGYAEDGSGKVEILGKCLEKCASLWPHIVKQNIVSIGDSRHDAFGAKEHNVHFIGIGFNLRECAETDGFPWFPDYRDIRAISDVLEKMWGTKT